MTNKLEVILDGFALKHLESVEIFYDDYNLGSITIYGSEVSQEVEAMIKHYIKPKNELDLIIFTNDGPTAGGCPIVPADRTDKHFEGTIRFDKQYTTKFNDDEILTTFSFVVVEKR